MPSNLFRELGARGTQRIGRLPIASGQTYKTGDFLALNSSGQLIQAVAAGNGSSTNGQVPAWSSGITNLIVGRAVEDAQPNTNDVTIVPTTKLYGSFIVAEPGTQFEVPIYHNTASSAYPSPAFVGVAYDLFNLTAAAFSAAVSAPAMYGVNIGSTGAVKCQIVDYNPDDYPGWPDVGQTSAPSSGTTSQYARTWIEFLGGATQLSGARPITRTN